MKRHMEKLIKEKINQLKHRAPLPPNLNILAMALEDTTQIPKVTEGGGGIAVIMQNPKQKKYTDNFST